VDTERYPYVATLEDGFEQVLVEEWIDSNGERVGFTVARRSDRFHRWGPPAPLEATL
jgi:hypothetical protein